MDSVSLLTAPFTAAVHLWLPSIQPSSLPVSVTHSCEPWLPLSSAREPWGLPWAWPELCVGRREPGPAAGLGDAESEMWLFQRRARLQWGVAHRSNAGCVSLLSQSVRVPEQPAVPSAPDPQGGRGQREGRGARLPARGCAGHSRWGTAPARARLATTPFFLLLLKPNNFLLRRAPALCCYWNYCIRCFTIWAEHE